MTERVDDLVTQLAERIDAVEERLEGDEQYTLEHASMLSLRRQAASLRRFLLPQRELYGQMTRNQPRSEEHTSELQSLMRISYAVFCLKQNKYTDELPPSPHDFT